MSYSPFGPSASLIEAFNTARTTHTDLLDKSDTWANYLKTYLTAMASAVTSPNVSVSWGVIQGSVPVTWGTAYTAPTIPGSLPNITDPLSATMTAFSFTEAAFTPDEKAGTSTVIDAVLGGEGLMSQDAWDDLYTDAADDVTAVYTGEALQAGNTCGMLGELPSEALLVRLDLAGAKHRAGLQKVRIGLAGEQAKAKREDITRMVEAGHQHDQIYGAIHNAEQARALTAAKEKAEQSRAYFLAAWQKVELMYRAQLTSVQASIAIATATIESEKTRVSLDNQVLTLAIENAKLAQGKGIADAQLYMQRLQFLDGLNKDLLVTQAQLAAHTMGSFLSAGSVNYGASATQQYGVDDRWSYSASA